MTVETEGSRPPTARTPQGRLKECAQYILDYEAARGEVPAVTVLENAVALAKFVVAPRPMADADAVAALATRIFRTWQAEGLVHVKGHSDYPVDCEMAEVAARTALIDGEVTP